VIGSLDGTVAHVGADSLILEVGGVGYLVSVPARLLAEVGRVGERVKLYTHTYVREDALGLFGFRGLEELELFQLLMSVKGIGPKMALGVLSQADARSLKRAVFREDRALLATVPGIGPKTAARMVLELRDKLKDEVLATPGGATAGPAAGAVEAAVRTLIALGYREAEARSALAGIEAESLETAVAGALRALDRPR
jgi:Holliday junction DNA helicase RuvA